MAYQIPPETVHFVDREGEQTRALRAVAEWAGRSRPLCLALSGLGGAGKTELAFRIARTLRDRYPDGVLYVDLDDLRRDGAVEVADVLGELLRSLGVEAEWRGHSFQDRCKRYWTKTDGKRLVVILDNARYGSEVVPLLPVSGASLVIVTSHGPLYDLENGAAVELALSPLDDEHASELLRRIVDDPRLAAEPDAVRGVVRLCSGLPAAVHVAGRWIRQRRRRPLSRLLADLSAELNEKGLPVVEKVWDAAYRGLGADAALLYRLLSGFPGPSFTPEAATALLGKGQDAAQDALEDLETVGLFDTRDMTNTRDERKRLPELLRAHAQRRVGKDGSEQESADGQRRIVRWYLRQAQQADALAAGTRMTFAEPALPIPGAPDVRFEDKAHAHRWLEAERHALFRCVGIAYGRGLDAEAWALCEPLWTHYLDHPHYADVIEAFRTGLAAAQRAGHIRALVRMRCQLGRPLWEQERFEEAEAEVQQAVRAVGALGESEADRKLAASAGEFRGMLQSARGDWAAAAVDFETSREVHRAIGNRYGVMLQTYRLGEAVAALGDLERAAELLEQAHTMAGELQRDRLTARTGFALGGVLHRLGRHAEAHGLYVAALTSARNRGADHDEARVLDALAALADEAGEVAEARGHREAARVIRERYGVPAP
jgi:tetratricopeptide (TPR) repeat protein